MSSTASAKGTDLAAASVVTAHPAWRQSWWWTLLRRKPLGLVAAAVILFLILVALVGPLVAPYPYEQFHSETLRPPSARYWFGTDRFGRDVLSRVIQGTRIAMLIGFLAMGFGTTVGALVGALSGYVGGWVDLVVQRIMDVLLAFPLIVLAMGMLALVSPSIFNIAAALALLLIPRTSKVIRTVALSVREHLYVEAARASGATSLRIVLRHVIPNCIGPYLVLASGAVGTAILVEGSLSFLGIGTPVSEPTWGALLQGSRPYVEVAPWLVIFPGLALSLAVFAFNVFGDALRDVLDPRTRS
jgi:peptide/nickel transport system permease protein